MQEVIIIGAGSAGLAIYYRLQNLGIHPLILDENNAAGGSWERRHPGLHLNTHRWFSHQPGIPIPKLSGSWVSRDDYIRYLREYSKGFNIEFNIHVNKIEEHDSGIWKIITSNGEYHSPHVIICTGADHQPIMPEIPGLNDFNGSVIHSADFSAASTYDGKSVLIIGGGNSAFDIGNHLVKRPLKNLWMSIRNPAGIVPKEFYKIPLHVLSAINRFLPLKIQDILFRITRKITLGDLSSIGINNPDNGVYSEHAKTGVTVAVDDGFINAVKQGKAHIIATIKDIRGKEVESIKNEIIVPDIIICATGYKPGLEPMIGHLNILNERGVPNTIGAERNQRTPGLWFLGTRGYIWGNMLEQLKQSKELSKKIKSDLKKSRTL